MAAFELPTRPRMNDLPDEIAHITEGYIPLSRLLTRLAQSTHNALQNVIAELARMPPPSAAASNGNAAYGSAVGPDDTSAENLNKKATLLRFAQEAHAQWVKALVITDWSRNAESVSKLIDLKSYMDQQRLKYDMALEYMVNIKRSLAFARLPTPDIKTAFQVLSTGRGTFMPDLDYIEPAHLSPDDVQKWVLELDTMLALRLNLTDFDKIPPQFRDYTIASGRVTFRVKGEFEVDLTIADEDEASQFWFIDFRFDFSPATETVPDVVRNYLELSCNAALATDGFLGCYRFLHEFVLSHKINEIQRQATELGCGLWAGNILVEPLPRAVSIQYWASRFANDDAAPKHWLMVGVNSPGDEEEEEEAKVNGAVGASSRIVAKWFRDGKEVSGAAAAVSLNLEVISVEDMLTDVIGKHIRYIFSTLRDQLASLPRFKDTAADDVVISSPDDDDRLQLSLRVGPKERVTVAVEPVTGAITLSPKIKFLQAEEDRLNASKSIINDGMVYLEHARCSYLLDEIVRCASGSHWEQVRRPVPADIVRTYTQVRAPNVTAFFWRKGWRPDWYLMLLMSPAGDSWWAVSTTNRQASFTKLPIPVSQPTLDDAFWNRMAVAVTGVITQVITKRALAQRKVAVQVGDFASQTAPGHFKADPAQVPVLVVKLSDLVPSMSSKVVSDDKFDTGLGTPEAQPPSAITRPRPAASVASPAGVMSPAAADTPKSKETLSVKPDPGSTSKLLVGTSGSGQPWCHDKVTIVFKGFCPPPTATSDGPAAGLNNLFCVSLACIRVLNPSFFRFLHRKPLGRDVVYLHNAGHFFIRICHELGTIVADAVADRARALDRLVDFMRALHRVPRGIRCSTIHLDEVSVTYPDMRFSSSEASPTIRRWPVRFDLSRPAIRIILDPTDPHAPFTQILSPLVNSSHGVAALMRWFAVTTDICTAFAAVVAAWRRAFPPDAPATAAPPVKTRKLSAAQSPSSSFFSSSSSSSSIGVSVEINGLDWLTLAYRVPASSSSSSSSTTTTSAKTTMATTTRTVRFHVQIFHDVPDPWWLINFVAIAETNPSSSSSSTPAPGPDPLVAALEGICREKDVSFNASRTGLAAKPGKGSVDMIMALDACMRRYAGVWQESGE